MSSDIDQDEKKRRKKEYNARYYAEHKDQCAASMARWKAENPERVRASRVAWRAANPERKRVGDKRSADRRREKLRAASLAWNRDNPERRKESGKRWEEKNRDRRAAYKRARRARQHAAPGRGITAADVRDLMARQKGRCALCRRKMERPELDHIVPLSRGGAHDPMNAQMLCKPCNCAKSAHDPIDHAQSLGLLL